MKLKLFFRNYKYDLLTLVVDISVSVVLFLKIDQLWAFIISLLIFILSTFIIIYLRTRDKRFYYFAFDNFGEEKDWVGRGKLAFVRNEKCFEITDSSAGFILPKTLNWDDYKYELDFKIVRTSLGFIVRAINLSNSVMFQIFNNRIRPHLRINGQWIVMDEMQLDQNLSLDNWYHLIVFCEKRKVRIRILAGKDKIVMCDKTQIIPSDMKVNKVLDLEGKKIETYDMQNIDLDFGAVGLRNYPGEVAYIKNIFVEKL